MIGEEKGSVAISCRSCHKMTGLPGKLFRLYLNFYEYEMLTETKVCSYFTAFLNNGQQPASDLL